VQEIGFRIAGPKAREIDQFGALIAVAAIGSVTLPGVRRALHDIRVGAHVVGEQRMRIYGVAEAEEQRRTQASSRPDRSRARGHRAFIPAATRRAARARP
jgi:hypothetical protein